MDKSKKIFIYLISLLLFTFWFSQSSCIANEIHEAAMNDDEETLKQLIESDPNIINSKEEHSEFCPRTPLHIASQYGRLRVARILLQQANLNINELDDFDRTPLYTAIANEQYWVAYLIILDPRTDINAASYTGNTPLLAACLTGKVGLVNLILDSIRFRPEMLNHTNDSGNTILHLACLSGSTDLVELLLNHPQLDKAMLLTKNDLRKTPLHEACTSGDAKMVELLISKSREPLLSPAIAGNTALHLAISNQKLDIVKFLAKQPGIDLNAKNGDNLTPIYIASQIGNKEIVQFLLTFVDIEPEIKCMYGTTPLHAATIGGHLDIVEILIKSYTIDINAQDTLNGNTALHLACIFRNTEIVAALLDPTSCINIPNYNGKSAIQIAQENKYDDICLTVQTHLKKWGFEMPEYDREVYCPEIDDLLLDDLPPLPPQVYYASKPLSECDLT